MTTLTAAELSAKYDSWVKHGLRRRYDLFPDPAGMRATYDPWPPLLGRYDRPDVRVGLIACGKAKLDRPAAAGWLYTGSLYQAARAYVNATCDVWGILSAMHGALVPGERIFPYDLTLRDLDADHQRAWAANTRHDITLRWGRQPLYVVVASPLYRTPFQSSHDRLRWWCPWDDHPGAAGPGLGLGQQLAWLKQHTPEL